MTSIDWAAFDTDEDRFGPQDDDGPAYHITKAYCGTASHWTVTYHREQVACRTTERAAEAYVAAATRCGAAHPYSA